MKQLFKQALLNTDKVEAEIIFRNIQANESNPNEFYSIFSEVLSEIGEEWERGEVALSQIYMGSRICEELIDKYILQGTANPLVNAKCGIVTFLDYHLLGKRIIHSVLQSSGYGVKDLGRADSIPDLLELIEKEKIEILLISTLMLHSALKIKDLQEKLQQKEKKIKIMVGGAPFIFDNSLWLQLGVEAMGITPADAISTLRKWTA